MSRHKPGAQVIQVGLLAKLGILLLLTRYLVGYREREREREREKEKEKERE